MITLHELHQRGGDAANAVTSFGDLHPDEEANTPEPDWKQAESHFLEIQAMLMSRPEAPEGAGAREQERRAENAAVDFLLTLSPHAGYRCPICQLHA